MALKNRKDIKLNKNHNGKEFRNEFRLIGLIKPVRKKEEDGDSWFDVPFYQVTETRTKKPRKVLQFNIETAFKNELKVELAGMEKEFAYLYSSKEKKSYRIPWDDRLDKSKYPNDTYHYIQQEWDKAEELADVVEEGMWADIRGHFEFSKFVNDDGDTINSVKRVLDQFYPLKNGVVEIKGVQDGDEFKVYSAKEGGLQLGYAKAKEGVASIKVGWLNPEGGKLYVCKIEGEKDGDRSEQEYTDGVVETERITIKNNVTNDIQLIGDDGKKVYVPYVRDFNSEEFNEVNRFEMQIGIKSTYQDEATKDTKVNAVYLDYGKERSTPKDVELVVYYKEPEEGKVSFADAFGRLNRLDFLVVEGIDNNRAEFSLVEVKDTVDDNPFEDVGEKVSSFERVSTGTKKGLEILRYIGGTYQKEILSEEEITEQQSNATDPFATVTISDDQLPF